MRWYVVHCFTLFPAWLNAAQMNRKHKAPEATKNICCTKGDGTVDRSSVNRRLEKFRSGCKNLNDQARFSRPRIVDSDAVQGETGELHSEDTRRAWHLTVQFSSSPSWPQQMHPVVLNITKPKYNKSHHWNFVRNGDFKDTYCCLINELTTNSFESRCFLSMLMKKIPVTFNGLVWLCFMTYQPLQYYIRSAYDKFPDFFRMGI